ncbi:MAG: tyrosine-type recombinase/integrase [Nitrosomonadales bacterium]|nr:tyrosine-type recombinase/integrase [Nitrosomonadales bacterium]
MALSKTVAGWLVDVQPGGRGGRRYRKTLPTKAEALAWETWIKSKVQQSPEWKPARRDERRLLDLAELWHKHHGMNLRAGENTYSRLKLLCVALGNPTADQFRPEMFAEYRARRLKEGISANNLNREHAYLRAVFNELARLGQWKDENPLAKVRQFKISERELSFLSLEQVRLLLGALKAGRSRDAWLTAQVCLATGARWSEAEGLRVSQMRNGAMHFTGTKSGKNRTVPVSDELTALLDVHLEERYGEDKAVATRFFVCGYSAFREAVEKCGLTLPKGQLTHVLRHTFASHFIMNGGNILVLQRILGHSSLTMTMRYAHLAPEHLQEAKALNPLARLSKTDNPESG